VERKETLANGQSQKANWTLVISIKGKDGSIYANPIYCGVQKNFAFLTSPSI
jgi:hypothetical protein